VLVARIKDIAVDETTRQVLELLANGGAAEDAEDIKAKICALEVFVLGAVFKDDNGGKADDPIVDGEIAKLKINLEGDITAEEEGRMPLL